MARVPMCIAALTCAGFLMVSDARPAAQNKGAQNGQGRKALIARAQVWSPTNVSRIDFKTGPGGMGAFAPLADVHCEYLDKTLGGLSPKFACMLGSEDELKVKYGGTNGEVYAEVAATRLLWALGFGADRMYSVRVVCKGCPSTFNGTLREDTGEYVFDPAAIERKARGWEYPGEEGWSWKELDLVETSSGPNRAHRDALKLLAVFIQHSDTKPQQQRLVCLDEPRGEGEPTCDRPFMMINDLGLTFGRANTFNANATGGMNLAEWSKVPVWKEATGCVGNLSKSFTGTLGDPPISEAGRNFLADLLAQLSDGQLHDLFASARVTLRMRIPGDPHSGFATVEEWVQAFKDKRNQIVSRRCA